MFVRMSILIYKSLDVIRVCRFKISFEVEWKSVISRMLIILLLVIFFKFIRLKNSQIIVKLSAILPDVA